MCRSQRPVSGFFQPLVKLRSEHFLDRIDRFRLSVHSFFLLAGEADAVTQGIAAPVRHQPVDQLVPDLCVRLRKVRFRQSGHIVDDPRHVHDFHVATGHVLLLLDRLFVFLAVPVGHNRALQPLCLVVSPFIVLVCDHSCSPSSSASSFSSCSGVGTITSASHGIVRHSLRSRSS